MTPAESERFKAAVRALPCTWPGCMRPAPSEPAHSNEMADGKARGMKCPDYLTAALCKEHHVGLDQGRHLSKQERREGWNAAWKTTLKLLFERGALTVT